mmetsp:Transcript_11745/g.30086  ORF Transcript_11745/g.30086 Transcript_11745/m.30086 type:complete len:251 (-) Transcript_11745:932-1684(-)
MALTAEVSVSSAAMPCSCTPVTWRCTRSMVCSWSAMPILLADRRSARQLPSSASLLVRLSRISCSATAARSWMRGNMRARFMSSCSGANVLPSASPITSLPARRLPLATAPSSQQTFSWTSGLSPQLRITLSNSDTSLESTPSGTASFAPTSTFRSARHPASTTAGVRLCAAILLRMALTNCAFNAVARFAGQLYVRLLRAQQHCTCTPAELLLTIMASRSRSTKSLAAASFTLGVATAVRLQTAAAHCS